MNKHSVLIVDDEENILEFLQYNFEKNNYTVYTANNGNDDYLVLTKYKILKLVNISNSDA